jgi:photosystem II stability/assembly factor-like uncharacterized protein
VRSRWGLASSPPAIGWRALGCVLIWLLALALGTAGCGRGKSTPAGRSPPASSSRAAVTVVPNTGLVAGQRLRVGLKRFPRYATVEIDECERGFASGGVTSCTGSGLSIFYTGTTGTASGPFVVQPAVSGAHGTIVRCRKQCLLVGMVIKRRGGTTRRPVPIASAQLSFSVSANAGLADEFLQELSWVSPTEGWALATQPCDTGTCVRLSRTNDGGRSWHALPDPPVACPADMSGSFDPGCVSDLSFASPAVGYLYGPDLLMTVNGGATWHPVPGLQVESFTVLDSDAWRVAYAHTGCPGPCEPSLQESKLGSRVWRTVIEKLAAPDRSGAAQIIASGSSLLLALYGSQAGPVSAQATLYRSGNAGDTWHRQADPCSGKGPGGRSQEEDLNNLAAAPGGFFAGVCSPHAGTGIFVVRSINAGRSWQKSGSLTSVQGPALIAAASPTTLAIANGATRGSGGFTARLLLSTDAGQRWRTVATDPQRLTQAGLPAWVGFQSPRVGSWLADSHGVWTTFDGGAHWTRTAFR